MIKTLLLPQLLSLFSVLSIKIPNACFHQFNSLSLKFIWNGAMAELKENVFVMIFLYAVFVW